MLRSRVFLGGQAVSMLGDGLAILARRSPSPEPSSLERQLGC